MQFPCVDLDSGTTAKRSFVPCFQMKEVLFSGFIFFFLLYITHDFDTSVKFLVILVWAAVLLHWLTDQHYCLNFTVSVFSLLVFPRWDYYYYYMCMCSQNAVCSAPPFSQFYDCISIVTWPRTANERGAFWWERKEVYKTSYMKGTCSEKPLFYTFQPTKTHTPW